MATAESVKQKLANLISTIKQVTGINSDDLITQVNILLSAYSAGRVTTISLPAASWVVVDGAYAQEVTVSGATVNSRIDLYPNRTQLAQLENAGIALTSENVDGVITIYSLNGKPSIDLKMQVIIMEVIAV